MWDVKHVCMKCMYWCTGCICVCTYVMLLIFDVSCIVTIWTYVMYVCMCVIDVCVNLYAKRMWCNVMWCMSVCMWGMYSCTYVRNATQSDVTLCDSCMRAYVCSWMCVMYDCDGKHVCLNAVWSNTTCKYVWMSFMNVCDVLQCTLKWCNAIWCNGMWCNVRKCVCVLNVCLYVGTHCMFMCMWCNDQGC